MPKPKRQTRPAKAKKKPVKAKAVKKSAPKGKSHSPAKRVAKKPSRSKTTKPSKATKGKRVSTGTKRKPISSRTKAFKRASEASKKGWITRRARALQESYKAAPESIPETATVEEVFFGPKTKHQDRIERFQILRKTPYNELTDNEVAELMAYSRRDGTVAKSPSRFRFHTEAGELLIRLENVTGLTQGSIVEGNEWFWEEASEIAEEYGYETREVYSLWFSP